LIVYNRRAAIPLTNETIDAFIAQAGRSGAADREKIRGEILKARGNSSLVSPLFARVDSQETEDLDTSLITLSILGELKDPTAIDGFERLIWTPLLKSLSKTRMLRSVRGPETARFYRPRLSSVLHTSEPIDGLLTFGSHGLSHAADVLIEQPSCLHFTRF
jgi:hypothetical protein